jgi:6-phosphofructokinase 1
MGAMAVDLLLEGKTNRVVAYRNGEFTDYDIDDALKMTKDIDEHLFSMTKRLSR